MKINFTKLPTTNGTIKVSLDGGQSFTDYSIADIHESGISLSDSQDYEKIRIQGPANVLKNLDVVSSVKVENANQEINATGVKYTRYYCYKMVSGYTVYECVYAKAPYNIHSDFGEKVPEIFYKENDEFLPTSQGIDSISVDEDCDFGIRFGGKRVAFYKRCEEEDIFELITEVQDEITITENGTYTADAGKSFKNVNVDVLNDTIDERFPQVSEINLDNTIINANTNYIISLIVKNGDSIRVIKEKAKSTYYYEDIQQGFKILTKNLEIYTAAGEVIDQERMVMYSQCSGGKVLCGDEWKTFISEEFEHRVNQEANVEIVGFDIQEV